MTLMVQSSKIFLLMICLAAISISGVAQSFDYQHRPEMDYHFTSAKINLQVQPEDRSVNGSVRYQLKANRAGMGTLTLNAAEMTIDSVLSRGNPVDFSTENDALNIMLTDSAKRGQAFSVDVFYHGAPTFGLLKSSDGTLWTSTLPRATRHWLPVQDHPRVQMVTTLSLQVPAGYSAFGSGVETDDRLMADSSRKVTFRTGGPIPITALSFGMGKWHEEGASIGIKRLKSYAETGSVSRDTQSELVNQAKEIVSDIEQKTGKDYPYQRLNVVILNDHYWEQKPYGAGTVYLYKNRGNLQQQLRRGLIGQWAGVFVHEEQWDKAWPITYLQTVLFDEISNENESISAHVDEPEHAPKTMYDHFSAERWNAWQKMHVSDKNGLLLNMLQSFLKNGPETITPEVFNDAWYRMSGQPSIEVPEFQEAQNKETSASRDSMHYRVDFEPNAAPGSLQLVFKAQKQAANQPVKLSARIISNGGISTSQFTFSGEIDTATVDASAGTQNVELAVPQNQPLVLEEHKPVSYLLYQLRNGETTEMRRRAAVQIGYHTDNPDIQLALNDVMKQKMEPDVKAALLQSYAKITDGAKGTQQRFVDALQSDNPKVRQAALEALSNYKSKEVMQRLKSLSQDQTPLSNRALELYMQRIDSAAAVSFTNIQVQQDTAGTKAITAIQFLAERGNTAKAVKLASYYMQPVYAYRVRQKALHILINYDSSEEAWKKRAQKLINDPDPRIRYLMAKNLNKIPGVDADEVLSSHQAYDARVYRVMNEY